jgi:hypothetical protein
MDWLEVTHRIRALRLDLARMDPRRGMPVAPPAGASEQAIAGAERRMGLRLPPSYRALLALHDGWPLFFGGAGLLGVRSLARGAYVGVARMVIDESEGGAGLIPFGIDADAETIFAWDAGEARADGELEVMLWTNGVGVRLPSFPDLLELIADMLAAEIEDRRGLGGAAGAPHPRRVAAVEPPASHVRRVLPVRRPVISAPRPPARSFAAG